MNNLQEYKNKLSDRRMILLSLYMSGLCSILTACHKDDTHKSSITPIAAYHISPKKVLSYPSTTGVDTLDFLNCESYNDMSALLDQTGHREMIDPVQYFQAEKKFFTQAGISQAEFVRYYNLSEIVRYGVYTELHIPTYDNHDLKELNEKLISLSGYTYFVSEPNGIISHGLHKKLQELAKNTHKPETHNAYPRYPDIPIVPYHDDTRYSRWEASALLQKNNISIRSTASGYGEKGNNPGGLHTCIHGIKKSTLHYLISLSQEIQAIFGIEFCQQYKILTLTGAAEKDSHRDNLQNENDHPGGSKVDLAIDGKKGIILGMMFARSGIHHFQLGNLCPISTMMTGYHIEVIPHAAHFDVLVWGLSYSFILQIQLGGHGRQDYRQKTVETQYQSCQSFLPGVR